MMGNFEKRTGRENNGRGLSRAREAGNHKNREEEADMVTWVF